LTRRARPRNARENVAYLPARNGIRHSPSSVGLVSAHHANTAI